MSKDLVFFVQAKLWNFQKNILLNLYKIGSIQNKTVENPIWSGKQIGIWQFLGREQVGLIKGSVCIQKELRAILYYRAKYDTHKKGKHNRSNWIQFEPWLEQCWKKLIPKYWKQMLAPEQCKVWHAEENRTVHNPIWTTKPAVLWYWQQCNVHE